MYMRKFIVLFIISACLLSCNRQKRETAAIAAKPESSMVEELNAAAAQVNSVCPVEAGEHNTLTGVTFKDNVWTYNYTIAEDSIVTFQNSVVNETIKERMKTSTRDKILTNPSMKTMVEALIKVKADLVYQFKGDKTGTVIKVIYTNPELRVMMDVIRKQN